MTSLVVFGACCLCGLIGYVGGWIAGRNHMRAAGKAKDHG